jgi:sugar fermentation stimulation protein A
MRFPSQLVRGRLVQRYKRFLADVILDSGEAITAACPNTGSMLGLSAPGSVVWLSRSDAASRKYPHTWEMVENDLGDGPTLVGINPMQPNRLVAEAISYGSHPAASRHSPDMPACAAKLSMGWRAASTSCSRTSARDAATSK